MIGRSHGIIPRFNPKSCHLKKYLQVFSIISLLCLLTINRFNPIAYGESAGAYLFMTPPMYIAKEVGELFNVAVNISNVADLRRVGFTVTYNASLLDIAQVVQGAFFPTPPKSHFGFEKNQSAGFVRVNMSLVDSETPRSGNGTLAWISFEVVQAPKSCMSSPLELDQTLLLNSASTPIVHDSIGAVYFWRSMEPDPPAEGRLLDIYTQKGGGGPDQSGGEFEICEMVYLTCRVSYNDDPVQLKLVGFEVLNPLNVSVVIRTAITDQYGFAEIAFRIPGILTSFGTWRAISLVSIAEETAWDTISFQVYPIIPVGGYSFSTEGHATEKPLTVCIFLSAILTAVFAAIKRKTPKKSGRHSCV
jgi:hypothetical protein